MYEDGWTFPQFSPQWTHHSDFAGATPAGFSTRSRCKWGANTAICGKMGQGQKMLPITPGFNPPETKTTLIRHTKRLQTNFETEVKVKAAPGLMTVATPKSTVGASGVGPAAIPHIS